MNNKSLSGSGNKKKAKILLVDDAPANIKVLVETLKHDYKLAVATNGYEALVDVESQSPPDLILLDVMMPEMSGYDVCERLKSNDKTKNIPVIFVTALNDEKDEFKGFEIGAVDYIIKPVNPAIVKARVKTHVLLKEHTDNLEGLVRIRTRQLHESNFEIVNRLARAAEYRDNETGLHIVRMSHFCSILGKEIRMNEEECELLHYASSMHDVGKIGIPDNILLKPGRLDDYEFEIMKTHTTIGSELLSGHESRLMHMAKEIALSHHEKFNGTGYPHGLKGFEIPLYGRITAVCDVFDALTSERPYKNAWQINDAVAELIKQKGSHFDPAIADLFIKNLSEILKIKEKFSDMPLFEKNEKRRFV